jgi:hypothetical protein
MSNVIPGPAFGYRNLSERIWKDLISAMALFDADTVLRLHNFLIPVRAQLPDHAPELIRRNAGQ